MPRVPLKKIKKTKLIIQSACQIIRYVQSVCHVSILSSHIASGSKTKES